MIGKAASPSGGASAAAAREALLPATAELQLLAEVLQRAIKTGTARVVTTDDGRWWLQVDRTSISRNERDLIGGKTDA